MIPKIRKIHHPLGHTIETPLLIPSYSSKGFAITKKGDKKISEISEVMVNCAQFLTEILLVSAYDIHQELIPNTNKYATTETIVIDSGGYETSNNFDFSTVKKYSIGNKDWKLSDYESVLNNWPEEHPNIIVSFDNEYRGKSIDNQVDSARSLFKKYPNSVSDYLIKPFTERADYVDMDEILGNIKLS